MRVAHKRHGLLVFATTRQQRSTWALATSLVLLIRRNDGELLEYLMMLVTSFFRVLPVRRRSLPLFPKMMSLGKYLPAMHLLTMKLSCRIRPSQTLAMSSHPSKATHTRYQDYLETQITLESKLVYQCLSTSCPQKFDTLNKAQLHLTVCPGASQEHPLWFNGQPFSSDGQATPHAGARVLGFSERGIKFGGVQKLLRASKSCVRPLLLFIPCQEKSLLRTLKRKREERSRQYRENLPELPGVSEHKGFYGGPREWDLDRSEMCGHLFKPCATISECDGVPVRQSYELDDGAVRSEMESSVSASPTSPRDGNQPTYIELPSPTYSRPCSRQSQPPAEDIQSVARIEQHSLLTRQSSANSLPIDQADGQTDDPHFVSPSAFQPQLLGAAPSRLDPLSSETHPPPISLDHSPTQSPTKLSSPTLLPFPKSQLMHQRSSPISTCQSTQARAIPSDNGNLDTQTQYLSCNFRAFPVQPSVALPSSELLLDIESHQAFPQLVPHSHQQLALDSGVRQGHVDETVSSMNQQTDRDWRFSTNGLIASYHVDYIESAVDGATDRPLSIPKFLSNKINRASHDEACIPIVSQSKSRQACKTKIHTSPISLGRKRKSSSARHDTPPWSSDNVAPANTTINESRIFPKPDLVSPKANVEIQFVSTCHSRVENFEESPLPSDSDEQSEMEGNDDDSTISECTSQRLPDAPDDDASRGDEQENGSISVQRNCYHEHLPQLPPIAPSYSDLEMTVSNDPTEVYIDQDQDLTQFDSHTIPDTGIDNIWLPQIPNTFDFAFPDLLGTGNEIELGGNPIVAAPAPAPASTNEVIPIHDAFSTLLPLGESAGLCGSVTSRDAQTLSGHRSSIEQTWFPFISNGIHDLMLQLPIGDPTFEEACLRDMGILHDRSQVTNNLSSIPPPAQQQLNHSTGLRPDEYSKPKAALYVPHLNASLTAFTHAMNSSINTSVRPYLKLTSSKRNGLRPLLPKPSTVPSPTASTASPATVRNSSTASSPMSAASTSTLISCSTPATSPDTPHPVTTCPVQGCNTTFSKKPEWQSTSLRRHMRNKHGKEEAELPCRFCKITFNRSDNRRKHESTIHGFVQGKCLAWKDATEPCDDTLEH